MPGKWGRATHCPLGHVKSLENKRWICKPCSYASSQAWHEKHRGRSARLERSRYTARKKELIEHER